MSDEEVAARRIALLLADVDGTLVTEEKVLTEAARRAVGRLHAAGIDFAVTSGRPPRGMAMLIRPLALVTPIAAFNGGVYARADLSIIEQKCIAGDAAVRVLAVIAEHGLDAWVYSGNDWLVRDRKAPHVAREEWTVKFSPRVVREFDGALDRASKIVGIGDDHGRVRDCEGALREALGATASVARSQPYYVDVTHPEANKGCVVDFLARHLDLAAAEIATIGDGLNDVQMFRRSGFSIAMGNAPDEAKRQADVVTASSGDEGFAKAVDRFILGGAAGAR